MPKLNDSFEVLQHKLNNVVWQELDGTDPSGDGNYGDFYVENTFPDSVVVRDMTTEKYYEVPYTRQDEKIFLGQPAEVEHEYVLKKFADAGLSLVKKGGLELSGPIVVKNEAKRIAYAPVLVPGEPDSDGEIVTKAQIEDKAHEWLVSYRNVDYNHRLNNVGVPVESYITSEDRTVKMDLGNGEEDVELPAGTWILASKFGEDTWNQIVSKELTGYSVMGVRRETMDAAIKGVDGAACKRTLLADLGEDWVPTHVSVVDMPAVPKAKFFALKSKEKPDIFQRIAAAFKPAKKEGRRFSENTYTKLQGAFDALAALLEEAEGERAEKKGGEQEMEMDKLMNELGATLKSAGYELNKIDEKPEVKAAAKEDGSVTETAEIGEQSAEGGNATTEEETAAETAAAATETEGAEDLEKFKAEISDKIDSLVELVGKRTATPKAIKGQDGDGEVEETEKSFKTGRDLYGRKKKGDK